MSHSFKHSQRNLFQSHYFQNNYFLNNYFLSNRRLFAPEVIQTSAMDCGPAALSCLLSGFNIPTNYTRLREACQTDVDGTSIDMLENVAQDLGLEANQVIAPVDHLMLPEAELLPALVTTVLPGGLPHFVVVWHVFGPFVQVMNPAVGRQWISRERFQRELYRYTAPFPVPVWRQWAGSEAFCQPLRRRLELLELAPSTIQRLLTEAIATPEWRPLATLDATTRFVHSLVTAGGIRYGPEAQTLLESLIAESTEQREHPLIPSAFWSVSPTAAPLILDSDEEKKRSMQHDEILLFEGVLLLHIKGAKAPSESPPKDQTATDDHPMVEGGDAQSNRMAANNIAAYEVKDDQVKGSKLGTDEIGADEIKRRLDSSNSVNASTSSTSPEAPAAWVRNLQTSMENRPEWTLWQTLSADGFLNIGIILLATGLAAGAITLEAALLRGLMTVAQPLAQTGQQGIMMGLCLFIALLLLLEWPLAYSVQQVGRRLELSLRIKLLTKIPRLSARYFHSRLVSDMAERAHSLQAFHTLPDLAVRILRLTAQIIFTAVGIIWLYPASAPFVIGMTLVTMLLMFLTQPLLAERDMRVRTHTGVLSRFYLDALLGLIPIRTHSAARSVRREHEARLVEWVRTSRDLQWIQRMLQGVGSLVSIGFSIAIVFHYWQSGGEASIMLLLFYWTLSLPTLSQLLFTTMQQYPIQHNRMARLLEPLSVSEEKSEPEAEYEQATREASLSESAFGSDSLPDTGQSGTGQSGTIGVDVHFQNVEVCIGGHHILERLNLSIAPGEHVAVVGASGAGKSTMAGLLLGWHTPSSGTIMVDERPLTGDDLHQLRSVTAWIDPSIQLWNRTLHENLIYGAKEHVHDRSGERQSLVPDIRVPEINEPDFDRSRASQTSLSLGDVFELADLYQLIDYLPDGTQTQLGENGGLVSGGEGQRVRMGRALLRSNVRLAILDEPFRGLDRDTRQQLLTNALLHWHKSTLIYVTHDVGTTQSFERVLVMDNGSVVEDGSPTDLLSISTSRYRSLMDAEEMVKKNIWQGTDWRHLWLEDGELLDGT